jgi:hypothetical protein
MARTPHTARATTSDPIPAVEPDTTPRHSSPTWQLWRPVGWRGPLTPEEVGPLGLAAEKKRKHNLPINLAEEVALHNLALLRDCYCTPAWVWELASWLAWGTRGGAWQTDAFWNPSAVGAAAVVPIKLDGSDDEHDGLKARDGAPALWCGATLVNGPHSDPGAWIRLCAAHGTNNVVAAIAPADGVIWYRTEALGADIEVNLGRLNYEVPPGLPLRQSSPRGSALLLWAPHLRERVKNGDLFSRPAAYKITNAPRAPVVIVRSGFCGGVYPENLFETS